MENYSKGRNVEEPLTRENIPIPDLPQDFLWMQVKGGSKMTNLLTPAMKGFTDDGVVLWSGSGLAIGKAISCCEIMKRSFKQAHQLTRICWRRVEEHWDPKLDSLDPLVVVREVPTIHILLSKAPLNTNEPGYQPPGSRDVFWKSKESEERQRRPNPKKPRSKEGQQRYAEQFAAMGLRTNNSKRAKNSDGESARRRPDTRPRPGPSRGTADD